MDLLTTVDLQKENFNILIESNNNIDKLKPDEISSQDQAFKVFLLSLSLSTNFTSSLDSVLIGFTNLFTLPNELSQDAVEKFLALDTSKSDIRAFFQDMFTS